MKIGLKQVLNKTECLTLTGKIVKCLENDEDGEENDKFCVKKKLFKLPIKLF